MFGGGIGAWEILVILLVLALIFGASRIPEIGSNLGKGIKNFKKSFSEMEEDEGAAEKEKLEEGEKEA